VNLRAGIVRSAAGVAAALLVGAAFGCGTEPRAQSADQLVYAVGVENGSTRGGLFVVDDNGENRRRLTSIPPGTVYDGWWSPKGRTILFQSDDDGEFWTIDADGTGLRRLGPGAGAAWSPDGSEIALVTYKNEIVVFAAAGGIDRTFSLQLGKGETAEQTSASWSPDGSQIALDVLEPPADTERVFVVDADGKSPAKKLGSVEAPMNEYFSDWSPDGKEIAFIRADEDTVSEAWVMNADGSDRRRVASDTGEVVWTADGKALRYAVEKAVYEVPAEGGPPKRVGDLPKAGLVDTSHEPGGDLVLVTDGRLIVRRSDGTGERVLTAPHVDAQPRWSPDGASIVFQRGMDGGKWATYRIRADGTGERPAPSSKPSDDRISPDGKWIAVVKNRSIHTGELPPPEDLVPVQSTLFIRSRDGTVTKELAKTPATDELPLVFASPVWSPDSKSILIDQSDPMGGGSGRIRQIPIDGSPSRTIAKEEAEEFSLAPDGTKVAFTTPDEGIGIVQLDDLSRKNIDAGADYVKWSPRSDKLAYVINDYANEEVYKLFVVDADGSHRRLVSQPGDAVSDFDWRPPVEPPARRR